MRKHWVLVGILAGSLLGGDALAQHKAPKDQPNTAAVPPIPTGEIALGSFRLPKGVTADGKPLAAGTYTAKVTAQEARPEATGITEPLERWVDLSKGGKSAGREVVVIVPDTEIKMVVKDPPPARGGAPKVQTLKGGDYLRVWFNRQGNHYLIYFPTGAAATQ
jgi:hypothetical protein